MTIPSQPSAPSARPRAWETVQSDLTRSVEGLDDQPGPGSLADPPSELLGTLLESAGWTARRVFRLAQGQASPRVSVWADHPDGSWVHVHAMAEHGFTASLTGPFDAVKWGRLPEPERRQHLLNVVASDLLAGPGPMEVLEAMGREVAVDPWSIYGEVLRTVFVSSLFREDPALRTMLALDAAGPTVAAMWAQRHSGTANSRQGHE